MNIKQELLKLAEPEYAQFQSKLTPTIPQERFIGVRVPCLRKLAKTIEKTSDATTFLSVLPHDTYEENMLHGLLIAEKEDFLDCLTSVETFLPYIDNWAVCDSLSPKVFAKNRERLLPYIRTWSASSNVYTCRFGIGMLMRHFLDDAFRSEYLEIPACINSDEYYINMMIAWFFATALAKQWDAAIPYITQQRLSVWVNNKTIQKARESYRIPLEKKIYLEKYKRHSD